MTGNETAKIIYKDDLPWSGEWTTWYPDGSKKSPADTKKVRSRVLGLHGMIMVRRNT